MCSFNLLGKPQSFPHNSHVVWGFLSVCCCRSSLVLKTSLHVLQVLWTVMMCRERAWAELKIFPFPHSLHSLGLALWVSGWNVEICVFKPFSTVKLLSHNGHLYGDKASFSSSSVTPSKSEAALHLILSFSKSTGLIVMCLDLNSTCGFGITAASPSMSRLWRFIW